MMKHCHEDVRIHQFKERNTWNIGRRPSLAAHGWVCKVENQDQNKGTGARAGGKPETKRNTRKGHEARQAGSETTTKQTPDNINNVTSCA